MQEILQKQGMIGGKQMRFRCRKTPKCVAIQVKSSGSSPTLQSKSVTPSSNTQIITPSTGHDGLSSVTVWGDSDLIASNIKNGVNIFGVSGTLISNTVYYNLNQTLTITNSKKISIAWSRNFPFLAIAMNFPQFDASQNTVMGGFLFYNADTQSSFSAGTYWSNQQHWYYNNLFYISQRDDSSVVISVIDDANFFVGYSCEYSIVAWS